MSPENPGRFKQFRLHAYMPALTDLKTAYVEVINPLLSREIVYLIRALSGKLRTREEFFKPFVEQISPDIPFAKSAGLDVSHFYCDYLPMRTFLIDELQSSKTEGLVERKLLEPLVHDLTRPSTAHRSRSKRSRPRKLLRRARQTLLRQGRREFLEMEPLTLTIRLCMLTNMIELLSRTRVESAALPRSSRRRRRPRKAGHLR